MGGDPVVGTTLDGRWRVVRRIGGGAMGVVYLAERANLGRQVALKLLSPDCSRFRPFVAAETFELLQKQIHEPPVPPRTAAPGRGISEARRSRTSISWDRRSLAGSSTVMRASQASRHSPAGARNSSTTPAGTHGAVTSTSKDPALPLSSTRRAITRRRCSTAAAMLDGGRLQLAPALLALEHARRQVGLDRRQRALELCHPLLGDGDATAARGDLVLDGGLALSRLYLRRWQRRPPAKQAPQHQQQRAEQPSQPAPWRRRRRCALERRGALLLGGGQLGARLRRFARGRLHRRSQPGRLLRVGDELALEVGERGVQPVTRIGRRLLGAPVGPASATKPTRSPARSRTVTPAPPSLASNASPTSDSTASTRRSP